MSGAKSKPTLESLTDELSELAEEEVRQAELVRSNTPLSREGVEHAQQELGKIKKRVEGKRRQVEKVQEEVRAELQRRERLLRDQITKANQAISTALEPIEKVMRNLNEGLTSMSLYLGRGEQIFTIREGERTADMEPIIIRQMVLAMDEETGIFAEDDGINADNVHEFDEWLLADEAHVEQIVPERKCVVALVPRWRPRRNEDVYGEPDEDSLTHFLIRNGDCLFRTSVQFRAGERLIPAPDEFIQFFKRKNYIWDKDDEPEGALKPGTEEYAQAMEQSDARSRHYLRIGLILQGLVDRTEIFHPLHPAGINMLNDPSVHSEKVRIITDGEGGLGSGLPTFPEWQKIVAAELRTGVRVVGAFNTRAFRDANDGKYGTKRVWPNRAENPPTGVPMVLERDDGGFDFKIRYPREEEIWSERDFEYRKSKTGAFCLINADDDFILPYDLVDATMMERFLGDRRSRRHYKGMWPLMRAIWKAKKQEELEESPFRVMLAGVLARENGQTVEEVGPAIPDLIRWFKLANRWHRPLLIKDGAPAVKLITAEYKRRVKTAGRTVDWDVVHKLTKDHPALMLIARPRRGGYIVLVPEEPDRNIFVAEHVYHASGEHKETRRWRLVGSRAERWMICGEAPKRWREWDRMADSQKHLTGPEREKLIEQIIAAEDNPLAITQEGYDGDFEAWTPAPPTLDPAHPLTSNEERRYSNFPARTWRWRRKGNDAPTLHKGSQSNYSEGNKMPWEPDTYSKSRRVLWIADDAEATALETRRLSDDAERYRDGAQAVYDRIVDNIAEAWRERQIEQARQEFMRTGHAEDWPTRRDTLKLDFPYERRRHSFYERDEAFERALSLALEEGLIEPGMLVEDMFTAALDHGLRGATIWKETKGGGRSGHYDDDALPPYPDELRGLPISLDLSELPEPDLEPEEEPDEDEPEDEEDVDIPDVAGMVRDSINEALAPEPESEKVVAQFGDTEILDPE